MRPLIEEGGKILQEANGVIRGLDPDGRIQASAKHKAATREATPEEYHLADILKELTGTVTKCIDDAKRRLEGMPHAKKELNPLWGLLSEPLFQILAAVGLLLSGVLGLVGRLVSFYLPLSYYYPFMPLNFGGGCSSPGVGMFRNSAANGNCFCATAQRPGSRRSPRQPSRRSGSEADSSGARNRIFDRRVDRKEPEEEEERWPAWPGWLSWRSEKVVTAHGHTCLRFAN